MTLLRAEYRAEEEKRKEKREDRKLGLNASLSRYPLLRLK
mgnify:CR=1 FL=1